LGVWLRTSAQFDPANVTDVHRGPAAGRPNAIQARMNTRGRLARCTVCGHCRNPSASDHDLVGGRPRSRGRARAYAEALVETLAGAGAAALAGTHAGAGAAALAGTHAGALAGTHAGALAAALAGTHAGTLAGALAGTH